MESGQDRAWQMTKWMSNVNPLLQTAETHREKTALWLAPVSHGLPSPSLLWLATARYWGLPLPSPDLAPHPPPARRNLGILLRGSDYSKDTADPGRGLRELGMPGAW